MTPDDKRRLAEIRRDCNMTEFPGTDVAADCVFLLRLLNEATAEADHYADMFHKAEETIASITAERDAAMAALRAASDALKSYAFGNSAPDLAKEVAEHCGRVLAAHSAATKPTEEVSG